MVGGTREYGIVFALFKESYLLLDGRSAGYRSKTEGV
jgi:hypothetical protein